MEQSQIYLKYNFIKHILNYLLKCIYIYFYIYIYIYKYDMFFIDDNIYI